jgi:hypothetical protein
VELYKKIVEKILILHVITVTELAMHLYAADIEELMLMEAIRRSMTESHHRPLPLEHQVFEDETRATLNSLTSPDQETVDANNENAFVSSDSHVN